MSLYLNKYLKYKKKYFLLNNQFGGALEESINELDTIAKSNIQSIQLLMAKGLLKKSLQQDDTTAFQEKDKIKEYKDAYNKIISTIRTKIHENLDAINQIDDKTNVEKKKFNEDYHLTLETDQLTLETVRNQNNELKKKIQDNLKIIETITKQNKLYHKKMKDNLIIIETYEIMKDQFDNILLYCNETKQKYEKLLSTLNLEYPLEIIDKSDTNGECPSKLISDESKHKQKILDIMRQLLLISSESSTRLSKMQKHKTFQNLESNPLLRKKVSNSGQSPDFNFQQIPHPRHQPSVRFKLPSQSNGRDVSQTNEQQTNQTYVTTFPWEQLSPPSSPRH